MDIVASAHGVEPSFLNRPVRTVLEYMQTISPMLLLVTFIASFITHTIVSARRLKASASLVTTGPGGRPLPKRMRSAAIATTRAAFEVSPSTSLAAKWLSVGVLCSFIADAAINMCHVIFRRQDHWWCGQAVVIYIVGSFFVYTVILISLIDTKPAPTFAQLVPWSVALPIELIILALYLTLHSSKHHESVVGDPTGGPVVNHMTGWDVAEVASATVRILLLIGIIGLYAFDSLAQKAGKRKENGHAIGEPTETTGLLNSNHVRPMNGDNYGTSPNSKDGDLKPAEAAWVRPTSVPTTSWWEYLSGYSLFFPYLWPSKSRRLQITVVACFCLVMVERAVNVLVPLQIAEITNILSKENGNEFYVPWGRICFYVILRYLQGNQGLLGSLRSFLWIPVSQYSYRELSTASFEHVHSLSLDFHLGKKTGEVLSALSKGGSINTFLEQITFQMVPMLIDLCVAVGYFLIVFDVYYALVVTISTFLYLYVTIRMAQWRAQARRDMANADRAEDAVKNDSMVAYETVKYFNAEQYEFDRYRGAVRGFQKSEYRVLFSLTLLNTCQNTVFMFGLLITCFIAAFQVSTGERKVGQFVALLTYMAQLQSPLNFFGTFFRSIQNALINSERLLELFREQPTVVDDPSAKPLLSCRGDIKFEGVRFAYDSRKPALNGLDFHCAPGTTTALVGESGGGKSTVFRLLFRFYDAGSGRILVDGRNVDDITIDSLRSNIGVVPQDTVLFNESIMYNLRYASPTVTEEEVYAACRAASIHDRILSFPDGYQTKVGERGLRLSGGEKQRVAIARTILKNPGIILLDEATAALDTETEEHIQGALSTLSEGRTMLVIAHRLSTITTADQILVLNNGQVVEKGTHEDLLAMKGRYSSMWRKQIRAQRAAAEAQAHQARADRLRSASATAEGDDSSSQSEEERQAATTTSGTNL